MKLTIINDDKTVYVDGLSFNNLALSTIPANIHAIQWQTIGGWIEYKDAANEIINELPVWANDAINEWQAEKDQQAAAIAAVV
jgi:hypothetical protein